VPIARAATAQELSVARDLKDMAAAANAFQNAPSSGILVGWSSRTGIPRHFSSGTQIPEVGGHDKVFSWRSHRATLQMVLPMVLLFTTDPKRRLDGSGPGRARFECEVIQSDAARDLAREAL
jgi:hypothetical protein